jgi:hypothetical protein
VLLRGAIALTSPSKSPPGLQKSRDNTFLLGRTRTYTVGSAIVIPQTGDYGLGSKLRHSNR